MDENLEEIYGALNVNHNGEKFYVEYSHLPNSLDIEILTTEHLSGHLVEDYEALQDINNKAEELIIKKINRTRLYL